MIFFAQLNSQTFFQAASATRVFLMKASFRQLQFLKGTNYASSPASLPAMNASRNQWSFHMADGSLGLSLTQFCDILAGDILVAFSLCMTA